MKTVKLHGELADRFGSYHDFEIVNAAEAVRALAANFPEFPEVLRASDDQGIGYHVIVDDQAVDLAELELPASKYIQFIPVIRGAGSGTGKVLLGSALIVAGVSVAAFTGGGLTGVGLSLVKVGAALTVTGMVQALTPVPSAPTPNEKPENAPSYTFNGPVNTTAQGQPVAIGYGRLTVGSAVISAGISVDELVSPQTAADDKSRSVAFSGGSVRI